MNDATLVLRADAGPELGFGHVMRMLALAQEWRSRGGRALFVSAAPGERLRGVYAHHHMEYAALAAPWPDPADPLGVLEIAREAKARLVFIDGYPFDATYQELLQAEGFYVAVMDDYIHHPRYVADCVLNQNFGAESLVYHVQPATKLLAGLDFVLLRDDVLKAGLRRRPPSPTVRRVLLTLGGMDLGERQRRLLRAWRLCGRFDVELVVAGFVAHEAEQELGVLAEEGFRLTRIGWTNDPASLMLGADATITAGGATCWELMHLGIPFAVATVADNQARAAAALAGAGLAFGLGDPLVAAVSDMAETLRCLLADVDGRGRAAIKGAELVDGLGRGRVVDALLGFTAR